MDFENKTGIFDTGSKIDMMKSDFRDVIDNVFSY